MWVRSLGWKDAPEEGIATHSNILGNFHGQRNWQAQSMVSNKELDMAEQTGIYVYIIYRPESLCCIPETNITL